MAVYILRPDDIGRYSTGWEILSSSGYTTYWEVLNEKDQDQDANCVHTDIAGPFTVKLTDFYAGSFIRPCRVSGIMVVATVRSDNPNPSNFRFRLRYSGYDYDSEVYTVSTSNYVEVVVHYPQLPNGDGWNSVRLSDLEIGLVYVDGEALWCTKLEVQVATELYPHYTLVPTDVGAHQDWKVHPDVGPAALAVQSFDGDESYIYSDTTWSSMDSVSSYDLLACFGFSGTNVWAVGLQGTIVQYDGTRWIKRLAPTASPTTNHLYGVWGLDPADLWVVGQLGTILHYDGTDWLAHTSGTVYDLAAVWGASATDVWAVGANGTALHYDGVSWSPVATGITDTLRSISGTATNDIWAVGDNEALLHWNGLVWTWFPPVTPGPPWDSISGVTMLAPADAWAVGAVGETYHWDGLAWSLVVSPTTFNLHAVWGSSSSNVVAVGENGTIIHWDGLAWETLPTATTKALNGVWGATPYRIFVVGQDDTLLAHPDITWWPKSTFLMDQLPVAPAPPVIDRVNAGVLVKNQSDTVDGSCAVVLRSGGVDYLGSTGTDGQVVPLDEKWHALDTYWLNDPATGWPSGTVGTTPWVVPEVNGLELGVLNLGGDLRCTSMALEVWLKYVPLSTTTLVPTGDGDYYTSFWPNRIPTIFPGGAAWAAVQDDPPDFGATYITGNADTAGTPLYGTFTIGALAPLPPTQQIYCLQHRTWLQLGSTDHAVVAPVFRRSGETYVGRPYRIDHTGASWFLLRTPFFTSPFSSEPWTQVELAALQIGVVILEGEVLITNVNIQVETCPLLITPVVPDPVDLQLTQGAINMMNRSLLDGTIYAVTDFALGKGGFVPTSPWQVVPVNPLDTALANELYRDQIDRVTLDRDVSPPPPPPPPQPTIVRYWCRLPRDVIRDAIGEVGLYATILWSPFPAEIGTKFLFALQHIPCQCLHQRATQLFEVSITYP
jgi:hypothetical protein